MSLDFDGQLDYFFIDEAGQVATANVVAMGGRADEAGQHILLAR